MNLDITMDLFSFISYMFTIFLIGIPAILSTIIYYFMGFDKKDKK